MPLYAGIDLHSNNNYLAIIDEDLKPVFSRRLSNHVPLILKVLEPYRKNLSGLVIESTYNWYWLVDALQDAGYRVHLANPSAIKQYEGLKHTDDKWDSVWLAQMLKLGILPEGYIYPKETRPMRDLLRRRMMFVQHRTATIVSYKSMVARTTGRKISKDMIMRLENEDLELLFDSPDLVFMAERYKQMINAATEQIRAIEKRVRSRLRLSEAFKCLLTAPGFGPILSMVIMLEVGDIKRFAKVGNYSSYCRCVSSVRTSNNKKKASGNRKNGNRYLAWAYIEAANFAIRYSAQAQRFYHRKAANTNRIVGIKALSNKLARATYYMMRDKVAFNSKLLFA